MHGMEHRAVLLQLSATGQQDEWSNTGLAGWELWCSTWGFCYLLSTVRAARAVTMINKATAREQSSLVSCTPRAGQGKHTASLSFEQHRALCTSARGWPRAPRA